MSNGLSEYENTCIIKFSYNIHDTYMSKPNYGIRYLSENLLELIHTLRCNKLSIDDTNFKVMLNNFVAEMYDELMDKGMSVSQIYKETVKMISKIG